MPFLYASPNEYLFKEESLTTTGIVVEIKDKKFDIYKIENSRFGNVLITSSVGDIASSDEINKSMVTYYTYKYIKENEETIREHFHITANKLDREASLSYRKILNRFRSLTIFCVNLNLPYFRFMDVCVKPSDELEVMKSIISLFPDWETALNNYRRFGGDIFYFTDKSDSIRYSFTEKIYKSLIATYGFLQVAQEITGKTFIESDVINPDFVAQNVNTKSLREYEYIQKRVDELSQIEKTKFDQASSEIDGIKIIIKQIVKINGKLDEIKDEYNLLSDDINYISVKDQKFRTDIDKLEDTRLKIKELNKKVESSYTDQLNNYNQKNFIQKLIDDGVGWVRSLFY